MTRVEKYRRYREEISNMKFETFSQKKEFSDQVDKIHNPTQGNRLSYEQIMNVHEMFDENEPKIKRKKLIKLTKFEIIYTLTAVFACTIVLVAMILVGINLWG